MSIKITALSASPLIRSVGSTRYIVFIIKGEEAAGTTPRVPLNLSLVLDRSGSMAGENKLELVKQAAAFVIDRLQEQDRVSLVAFDDEIKLAGPSSPANPASRETLKAALQKLKPGGSTNLSEGWFRGIEEVAKFQAERTAINQVWLFTDGQANQGITGREELATHAGQFRKRGIITTTFGFGSDTDENLLEAIGEKGGGRFQYIKTTGTIAQTFAGELEERLRTVGRGLALQIDLPPGCELENLNDFEMTGGKSHTTLHLGDIFAGEEKKVVIKFRVPAGTIGQVLRPEVILMYTDPAAGSSRAVLPEPKISLTYAPNNEVIQQRFDPESGQIVGSMLVEQARREILEANRRHEYKQVRVVLEKLRSRLDAAHLQNIPEVAALLKELENQAQQAEQPDLDVAVRKSMHYQAYNAQKSRRDYNNEPPVNR